MESLPTIHIFENPLDFQLSLEHKWKKKKCSLFNFVCPLKVYATKIFMHWKHLHALKECILLHCKSSSNKLGGLIKSFEETWSLYIMNRFNVVYIYIYIYIYIYKHWSTYIELIKYGKHRSLLDAPKPMRFLLSWVYGFGMIRGLINNVRIFIFGWTIPFIINGQIKIMLIKAVTLVSLVLNSVFMYFLYIYLPLYFPYPSSRGRSSRNSSSHNYQSWSWKCAASHPSRERAFLPLNEGQRRGPISLFGW